MTSPPVSIRPRGDDTDWGATVSRLDKMLRIRTDRIRTDSRAGLGVSHG